MDLIKKYTHVIYVILILTLLIMLLIKTKEVNENHKEINQLNNEVKSAQEEVDKKENKPEDTDEFETNTFEEDLKWFVTKVYESNDRYTTYEDIKDSVNQSVLTDLLGEDLPPPENEKVENAVKRSVTDIEVFGRYANENRYKAVLTFEVSYEFKDQEDSKKVMAYTEIEKENGSWIITKLEEY